MHTAPIPTRLFTAFAALSLAACGGTVDFSIEKDMPVDTAVAGGTTLATVDLAAEAGGAWKHRDEIDKVTVVAAEATVTSVSAPPNTAETVSGDVWLLPDGVTVPTLANGSVKVGSYLDEPVVVGNVVALDLTPELNAFVKQAFNGSGRFSVYLTGAGAGGARVTCVVRVVLGAKLKWTVF